MRAPQLGDWVRLDEAYPETVRRFLLVVHAAGADSPLGRDLVRHVGEWGQVWPVLAHDAMEPLFGVGEARIYVRWPDGEVDGYYARWLVRYEPPAERQALGLWLLEHQRPRLADLVRCPVDETWQRAVAAAWWHQPEARALCEAAGHPWLWGAVWACAATLGLQRTVTAERAPWGLVLSTKAADGSPLQVSLGEGTPVTEGNVQHVVDLLRAQLEPAAAQEGP